jgi:hypothetical protein
VESKLGPLGTSASNWPIVPASGVCEDGEFGGIKIGRGNGSTRRKPAPAPLCPPQIPLDQTRTRTRAAAVGSQRLTAWAMARPSLLNCAVRNSGPSGLRTIALTYRLPRTVTMYYQRILLRPDYNLALSDAYFNKKMDIMLIINYVLDRTGRGSLRFSNQNMSVLLATYALHIACLAYFSTWGPRQ